MYGKVDDPLKGNRETGVRYEGEKAPVNADFYPAFSWLISHNALLIYIRAHRVAYRGYDVE
jgi:hypothetical protein